jgi:hypothetical protein
MNNKYMWQNVGYDIFTYGAPELSLRQVPESVL